MVALDHLPDPFSRRSAEDAVISFIGEHFAAFADIAVSMSSLVLVATSVVTCVRVDHF
jgi:hypothetical protein